VAKRSYGSGSLYTREDGRGKVTWYRHFRIGRRQIKKQIGPKREPGSRDGLTRAQAEARLRKLIDEGSAPHSSPSGSPSPRPGSGCSDTFGRLGASAPP
jgi:hypothetical protein